MTFDAPSLVLALLAPFAEEVPPPHAGVCVALAEDAARLRCWDRLAQGVVAPAAPAFARPDRALPDPGPRPPDGPVLGRWQVRRTPGFDGEEVVASLRSDEPVGCGAGHATLYLRCTAQRTSLYVLHGCDTRGEGGAAGGWPVEVRLGDGGVEAMDMTPAAEGDALGFWTYRSARPMAERIATARTLRMRFEDYLGRRRDVACSLRGAGAAVHAVRAACGW